MVFFWPVRTDLTFEQKDLQVPFRWGLISVKCRSVDWLINTFFQFFFSLLYLFIFLPSSIFQYVSFRWHFPLSWDLLNHYSLRKTQNQFDLNSVTCCINTWLSDNKHIIGGCNIYHSLIGHYELCSIKCWASLQFKKKHCFVFLPKCFITTCLEGLIKFNFIPHSCILSL